MLQVVLSSNRANRPEFDFDQRKIIFDDADEATDNYSANISESITEDFNLMHNILYYIYTDRITFGTDVDSSIGANLPKLCPAEEIYEAADRMLLNELKQKALNFLELTCTIKNITSRVMSEFAHLHSDVAAVYDDYFRKNWCEIQETAEFAKSLIGLDDTDEVLRRSKKFLKLMKGTRFPKRQ
jgi:hypothetical protein